MTDESIPTIARGLSEAERRGPSKSWIWDHAKALKRPLIKMAPEDFRIEFAGGLINGQDACMHVSCSIHNASEAEAVREIIGHLSKSWLTAHREMIRGDIYPPEPAPTFQEELAQALGDLQQVPATPTLSKGEEM